MRPASVVVMGPEMEQTPQVVLCQGKHEVQTLAPQCADEPFAEGVGLRSPHRCLEHPQPQVTYAMVKLGRENAVPVMQQKTVAMIGRNRFPELLEGPLRCGMGCNIDMEEAPGRVLHQDKHVEEAKGGRDHHTKVTSDNTLSMIADKRPPALGGNTLASTVLHAFGHVLTHRARRHPQPQLKLELISNAFLTPRGILPRHTTDERLEIRRDRWASGWRLPPPEEPKALPMPAEKRRRLDNHQGLTPVKPAPEPHEGETRGRGCTPGFDLSLLIEGQLFTEKKILCSQRHGRSQPKPKVAHGIDEECVERRKAIRQTAEVLPACRHQPGTLL